MYTPLKKIAAIDPGDQWVGVALSDVTQTLARPFTTVTLAELDTLIERLRGQERVETIVIGYPKTMRGTESEQTKKVRLLYEQLQAKYPDATFVLWDERFSSQRAAAVGGYRTKEEKLTSHARAAAFILDSYLSYLKMQNPDTII